MSCTSSRCTCSSAPSWSSSSCRCTCSSCTSSCNTCSTSECPAITAALVVSNAWNVPSCGGSALLYIAGLENVVLGTYIANPTYGTFKITGFNSINSQVTVLNECFAGNAAPGTVVPAYTSFVYSIPPAITTYEEWVPTASASGTMTVSLFVINLAESFSIGTTRWFNFAATFTLGGVASNSVYIDFPQTAIYKDINVGCTVETPAGVNKGGFWKTYITDPSKMLLGIEGFANYPLGACSVQVQGFYEVA